MFSFFKIILTISYTTTVTLRAGFHPNTFVYNCFLPKIQFLYCFLNFNEVFQWWAPRNENFFKFRYSDCWKIHFQHSFWLQKHSLHIISLQQQQFFLELLSFMGNFMRLSFKIQFKIKFLLMFTGCRKVLRKMPDVICLRVTKNDLNTTFELVN